MTLPESPKSPLHVRFPYLGFELAVLKFVHRLTNPLFSLIPTIPQIRATNTHNQITKIPED